MRSRRGVLAWRSSPSTPCCRPPLSCRRRLNITISRSSRSSSSSRRRRQHRRHPLCRPQCRRFRASRRGRIVRRPSIDRPRGRHQSISCTLLHSPSSTHPPYNSAHTSNPASASVTLTPTLNLSLLHHSPSTTHPHRSTSHATFTTHPRHTPSPLITHHSHSICTLTSQPSPSPLNLHPYDHLRPPAPPSPSPSLVRPPAPPSPSPSRSSNPNQANSEHVDAPEPRRRLQQLASDVNLNEEDELRRLEDGRPEPEVEI